MRRVENDTLAAQVRTHLTRTPGAPPTDQVTLPFDCECGRSGCDLQVPATVPDVAGTRTAGRPLVHAQHA